MGEVFATRDGVGSACWLPPRLADSTLARQIAAGMLMLPLHFGLRGFRRLVAYDKWLKNFTTTTPPSRIGTWPPSASSLSIRAGASAEH